MNTGPADHWSNYWASGFLTSLPQDFSANYDGEIATFWTARFAAVPRQGQVLDLCTGNGAIALLAASWARASNHPLHITAVDAAHIDTDALAARHPDQTELFADVQFLGDQPLEALDLPAGRFDLVTSQYGIEYCDWGQAAARVAGLLKPGGRFAMVCHASSSEILAYMEAEHAEYRLLDEAGFLEAIQLYLDDKLEFRGLHDVLKSTGDRVYVIFQTSRSPFLKTILDMLNATLPMDEAAFGQQRDNLFGFLQHVRFGYDRLREMLQVNQAIHDNPDWYRVFTQAGLDLQDSGEILYRGENRSGTFYRFVKPDG